MYTEATFETVYDTGLRLPMGDLIFPPDLWHGRGVETEEDRLVIVQAIQESERNLGLSPGDLLQHYKWHVRERTIVTTTKIHDGINVSLDSPAFLPEPEQVNTTADADFDDEPTEPSAVDTGL